jgi:hypothetical protein
MSLQMLKVTNGIPLYLPYDSAPVAFGEPFSDVTFTVASPGVFTAPGYQPTNGDSVQFSTTGTLPSPLAVATTYYVVNASGDTFEVSATSGGAAITTATTGSGTLTMHLLVQGAAPITLPFKPGNTVIGVNFAGSPAVVQGAPDLGAGSGDPTGPGVWVTLATVPATGMIAIQLSYDWLQVSTTSGIVYLLQD